MQFDDPELIAAAERVRQMHEAEQRLALVEATQPSLGYVPSEPSVDNPYGFQLLFHRSIHPVRFLCPGNGAGKSTSMGQEANAWATHSNVWQITPKDPVSMIWFGPGASQWNKIRFEVLEKYCFDKPYTYQIGASTYVWPDGSRLEFRSYESGWEVEQGINPHLVFFDELFGEDLWIEMQLRRRGKVKTRFCIGATQTLGTSWMEEVLYRRWLKYHMERGIDEDTAMLQQLEPYIWCWPKGGIRSNPGMDAEDIRHYEEDIEFMNDAERKVRLGGGFGDWSGAGVFDPVGVRMMQDQARLVVPFSLNASLVPVKEKSAA